MKNIVISFLIITIIISCQKKSLQNNTIVNIGKELILENYNDMSNVVIVGEGLKVQISKLKDGSVNFTYKVLEGDLNKPWVDGKAGNVLQIASENKKLWIRVKYDDSLKKYHILGWVSSESANY